MSLYRSVSRHLTRRASQTVVAPQRRWARVHDVRFLATQQSQERVTDRYKDKLKQKAQKEGHGDIGSLKEAYKEKIDDLKHKASVPGANAPLNAAPTQSPQAQTTSPWPKPPPPPEPQADPAANPTKLPPGVKTLSSFIDVGKSMDLPHRELEALWRLRHANSPQSLCATMQAAIFSRIARTAKRHPQFILPGLPANVAEDGQNVQNEDKAGAAIHFMQFTFPSPETATVLFTHLAEYKLRGEHAQPHTTLTHHLELAEPKGIVLCQGHVVPDRGVSMDEGRWLIMQLQKFYNIGEDVEESDESPVGKEMKKNRRTLVEKFSQGANDFRVEDLLQEAERVG
ncbi:MAG: hypothetical protein Q9162_005575 [Coniocarpon cinnabarinum]